MNMLYFNGLEIVNIKFPIIKISNTFQLRFKFLQISRPYADLRHPLGYPCEMYNY